MSNDQSHFCFPDLLAKVLTFQKAMSACECTPQEMSRAIRIINEIVRSQAPVPLVCRMIQVIAVERSNLSFIGMNRPFSLFLYLLYNLFSTVNGN